MIKQMEVLLTQPDAPELPLGGFVPPDRAAVQVRDIQGLGPVKSGISSTPYATGRGSLFQGASIETRNLVLTLGLNPDWSTQTIASLKHLLYRYFMTGTWSELRFQTDETPEVYIKGVSESFEPNIFSQDPEMQISIICTKPDFVDLDTTLINGTTVDLAGVDLDVLVFEDMDSGSEPDIEDVDYIGTAPAGFELRIVLESPDTYSGDIAILNTHPDGVQLLVLENVLIDATHRLDVNTVRSTRYVYNVNPSTNAIANILAKMTKESNWPEFQPGANRFAVYSTGGGLAYAVGYLNRFGAL